VAVFLFEHGSLRGPVSFSTLGMRIQNEQSGSSSLFAQPMALEAVPEVPETSPTEPAALESDTGKASKAARTMLEARMEAVLAELEKNTDPPSATIRQGHLALLKRWYYRPEVKREGEICFPDAEDRWPIRQLLRSVGRVAAKALAHSPRAGQ
jgi:hypothetical protein